MSSAGTASSCHQWLLTNDAAARVRELVRDEEVRVVDEQRQRRGRDGEVLEMLIDRPGRSESLDRKHHEPHQQARATEQPEIRKARRQRARSFSLFDAGAHHRAPASESYLWRLWSRWWSPSPEHFTLPRQIAGRTLSTGAAADLRRRIQSPDTARRRYSRTPAARQSPRWPSDTGCATRTCRPPRNRCCRTTRSTSGR